MYKMINKIKKIFYTGISVALILPAVTMAAGYTKPTAPAGVPKDADLAKVIEKVLNYVLGFLAVLSILMIVIAGIMYITSGGDEGRVDKAKSWLTYSIVGLIVALLGFVIVSTVSNMLGAG